MVLVVLSYFWGHVAIAIKEKKIGENRYKAPILTNLGN